MRLVELGLGLLSIGRTWGTAKVPPPTRENGRLLIHEAYSSGIRFFDTAPAYGESEIVFGEAVAEKPDMLADISIATKMGEDWNPDLGVSWVSHSRDDLLRSINRSLDRLSRIDVLQLHKANPFNVTSSAVLSAFEHARKLGVKITGASVSDMETAALACQSGHYDLLQFPYNAIQPGFVDVFTMLRQKGMKAIINRPFAMGQLALQQNRHQSLIDAFSFVLGADFTGVVLTGTSSTIHLATNMAAFAEARRQCG
ncbi:aldo/keto reductase [Mesorhizobium sp. B1-1-5]|uniref:aldo/keto reductase n=1 Tax=Mesorhizobium sp. B1-1-5 TaxID=2589979 RepID=UPI0015E470DF|nr:aldo/keto reductase [Mesorhizobium sp. B1-1-5]